MKILRDEKLLRLPCMEVSMKQGLKTAKQLFSILDNYNRNYLVQGIGLSAIQCGIYEKVCIINLQNNKFCLINPKIIEESNVKFTTIERCLSLPGIEIETQRPLWIRIKSDNLGIQIFGITDIAKFTKYDKLLVTCIAHEIDHCFNRLIIDFKKE